MYCSESVSWITLQLRERIRNVYDKICMSFVGALYIDDVMNEFSRILKISAQKSVTKLFSTQLNCAQSMNDLIFKSIMQ